LTNFKLFFGLAVFILALTTPVIVESCNDSKDYRECVQKHTPKECRVRR